MKFVVHQINETFNTSSSSCVLSYALFQYNKVYLDLFSSISVSRLNNFTSPYSVQEGEVTYTKHLKLGLCPELYKAKKKKQSQNIHSANLQPAGWEGVIEE